MLIKFILKQIHSSPSGTADNSVIVEDVFDGSLFTIGSDATNTVVLAEAAPEQAVIIEEGEFLTLHNSAEGTVLNGRNLRREAIEPLAFGDEIKIGNHSISIVSYQTVSENNQNGTAFSARTVPLPEPIAPLLAVESEKNFLLEQNGKSESPAKKPSRNFADILNTLRTEEDSFYFIVKNGSEEDARIPLEQPEMPLGFDAKGKISYAVTEISALYAIVRKDWSGIVVESQRGAAVLVNDEMIQTPRRLRNGDRLRFNAGRKSGKPMPHLELHEPSSVVALESILENPAGGESKNLNVAENLSADDALTAKEKVPVLERNFFGYFSFFEIVSMWIGTLITAVLIFLLLELIVN